MALITGKMIVWEQIFQIPDNASRFYIMIDKTVLSAAYNLTDGDKIMGEVLELELDIGVEQHEIKGKEITLILKKSAGFDYLFLSRKDWETHFRDWGLVRPNFKLNLRLTQVVYRIDSKVQLLYPKRDLTLGYP